MLVSLVFSVEEAVYGYIVGVGGKVRGFERDSAVPECKIRLERS